MAGSPGGTGARSSLTQAERRELIRRRVVADGSVTVEQLTAALGISVMTAHRDLDALQESGWLVKVRGGATAHPLARLDTSVRARLD
jgi:DeoR/GlpR family transcriptional regulator of sugar metabolism